MLSEQTAYGVLWWEKHFTDEVITKGSALQRLSSIKWIWSPSVKPLHLHAKAHIPLWTREKTPAQSIALLFRKAAADFAVWLSTSEQDTQARNGSRWPRCPTVQYFWVKRQGGLDLVGSAALCCAGLKKGGIKRGLEHFAVKDPSPFPLCLFTSKCSFLFADLFLSIHPSLLWYILPPSPPPFLYSSIWPHYSGASFPMWSPASRTYCPCTACTLISCNMVRNVVEPPVPPCTGIP